MSNRLSQKERLAMVMAYLRTHESLSIAQYARMTGLGKATAEAELDVFATDWGGENRYGSWSTERIKHTPAAHENGGRHGDSGAVQG